MPTLDPSTAVARTRDDLPRLGKLPLDPTTVRVVETAPVSDDQGVHRRVLFAWSLGADALEAVREFRVYVRPADAPEFDLVATTESMSVYPCCGFSVGVQYEVAVVSVGLDGPNHRPPDASTSRTLFQIYGQEMVPPPPTGLQVRALDSRTLVLWTPPEYAAPVQYEVRIGGQNFEGSTIAWRGRETFAILDDLVPLGLAINDSTVHVGAMTMTGLVGEVASADVQIDAPADTEIVDEDVGNFGTGTLTGVEESGSYLVVSDGETGGTYESPVTDLGAIDTYTVLGLVKARIDNLGITWGTALFTWDSAEAGRRRWEGGAGEWFPTAGIAWPEPLTWGELEDTWDDYEWLTWGAYGEERNPDDPSAMTWDDADFEWGSEFAASWTWDGPLLSAGTGWTAEVAFSDDNSTWSDWEPLERQTRDFRYLKWRLTITQPVPALAVVVEYVAVTVVQLRTKGQRWEEEEPSGVLNGVNDSFGLTYEPNAAKSLQLYLDGTLVRPADYTLAGSTITFGVAPNGAWMVARYQH